MIIPQGIAHIKITFMDQYFDLKGLSLYSSLGVSTLRDYINRGELPCFELRGKLLVKKTEFDTFMEGRRSKKRENIKRLADDAVKSLTG